MMAGHDEIPILSDDVPVVMPDLPASRPITTSLQFKALGDPLRWRIINVIHHQPATAKRISELVNATPGTVGHHLHVLEEAGLVQVVARRLIRGTVANYYTRTARVFVFSESFEGVGNTSLYLNRPMRMHDEFSLALADWEDDPFRSDALLHVRLTEERMRHYYDLLDQIVDEMIHEPSDPHGRVYTTFIATFTSPGYIQVSQEQQSIQEEREEKE